MVKFRNAKLAACLRTKSSLQASEEEMERAAGQLIGTVELSFSASTRTKNLTLNPPEVCHLLLQFACHH